MNYNYHTHTKYCHHATGEVEEYIESAIKGGIKYLGFSDHIPFKFSDGYESSYRVSEGQVGEYFSGIKELRKKYQEKIDIKIGFEMEYYAESFEKMLQKAIDFGAEYLILGQHFYSEEYPFGLPVIGATDDELNLKKYVECIIDGMKSGVFTYIAHPDMISFTGDMKLYEAKMREICIASREIDVPLEINFQGMRLNRRYPNEEFWKIAGEEKSPVTFGCDAHKPQYAFDAESLEKAKDLVEKYNLNYIGKPKLRMLKDIEVK